MSPPGQAGTKSPQGQTDISVSVNDTYDSKILDHYRNEAAQHGDAATSTMADNRTRELETEFLLAFVARYAPAGALIADVGCGNGYTLAQVRKALPEAQLVGLEFTPELRRIAETRFAGDTRTTIADADVRKPFHGPRRFDAIICTLEIRPWRCTILPAPSNREVTSPSLKLLRPVLRT